MALKVLRAGLIGAALVSALSIGMMPTAEARDEGGSIAGSWSGVEPWSMPRASEREHIVARAIPAAAAALR